MNNRVSHGFLRQQNETMYGIYPGIVSNVSK